MNLHNLNYECLRKNYASVFAISAIDKWIFSYQYTGYLRKRRYLTLDLITASLDVGTCFSVKMKHSAAHSFLQQVLRLNVMNLVVEKFM